MYDLDRLLDSLPACCSAPRLCERTDMYRHSTWVECCNCGHKIEVPDTLVVSATNDFELLSSIYKQWEESLPKTAPKVKDLHGETLPIRDGFLGGRKVKRT